MIENKSYNSELKLQKKFTFIYNDKGFKIENYIYSNEDKLEKKNTYIYDSQNNVIEESCFDSVNALLYKTEYKYEYDSQNNWIKKIKISEGKAISVVERKIEYFE